MGGVTRFLMLLSTTATPFPLLRLSRFRHRHRLPLFSPSSLSQRHYHHHVSTSFHHPIKATKDDDFHAPTTTSHFSSFTSPSTASHPWPEWCGLIRNLDAGGYFSREGFRYASDELVSINELPEEFVREVNACLAFAHDRPEALGMVWRRDVEVVVENGTPFLFKIGDDTVRRMRMFLDRGSESDASNDDRAYTIDLMRFLLSYASNPLVFEEKNVHNVELVLSSVRNLLNELAQISFAASPSNIPQMVQNRFPGVVEQRSRMFRQNIEMKRGDWICPRCSFMNFAKNVKCLECEEARPKRQLTGGEWECPQCDFFNYGRNMACLRCDCKRPGLDCSNSRLGLGYGNTSVPNSADIDSRLAANEEKAQRWFSKVSQLDSTADIGSTIADEDFPEIMPLRKGVNRFVVSTRKTPLERRLAKSQYQRNLDNGGYPEGSHPQGQNINETLDDILGRKSGSSESNYSTDSPQNARTSTPVSGSTSHAPLTGTNSNYVPFVPLPPDMFANKSEESRVEGSETGRTKMSFASSNTEQTANAYGKNEFVKLGENWQSTDKPVNETMSSNKEEGDDKSDSWFKRITELHNVKDEDIGTPSEDFPEVMPLRKGENRFVVSKKKDRSLTSPLNKRRMAMEQANNTNFVPFVPFPPDYFAKKNDRQTATENFTHAATGPSTSNALLGNQDGSGVVTGTPAIENHQYDSRSFNSRPSGGSSAAASTSSSGGAPMNEDLTSNESMNSKYSSKKDNRGNTTVTGSTHQLSQNLNGSSIWNEKSLEGSAVKEMDPLDMSEEAKAERWFRRVAQIKDISELSQIPDEDFPSIMPMRKGVNRFVVSKRKTPLERRLTSTKYKRNLPTVSSDPVKENNNN